MGKEQDLLQASKAGNDTQLEKLLANKNRKASIQSFMSRTVNSNHQDEMGYTALHYAALNGHRSSVQILLKYDASTNIPDNSGNYPLHLAAWNGHAEVARILINTGPSRANVNEQNGTEDTALHSASQFGHNQVVAVLLENHADPSIRNSRNESALDLAAQYGRMETVKLLLSYHPNLLEDLVNVHTPFHLAARNGHMNVVSYLLSCGMSVNTQCDSGTALHEAALYGKVDVVNLLLQCGIDVNAKDEKQQTVMDLLVSHPSARTREIGNLIYDRARMSLSSSEHLQGVHAARMSRSSSNLSTAVTLPYRPASAVMKRPSYDDVPGPVAFTSASLRRSGTYDAVPSPRSRNESLRSQLSYDIVPTPRRESTEPARGNSVYSEVKASESSPPKLTPMGDGYALLGPPDEEAALTPRDIHSGYTVLGAPTEPRTVPRKLRPPKQTHVAGGASDPYGDYSKLRISASGPSDPGPMAASLPSSAYSVVSPQQQAAPPRDHYDMVAPVPKPRSTSRSKQSVYQVPPSPSAAGAESTYGLVGAPTEDVTRPANGRRSTVESLESSASYDLVTLPAKRAPTGSPQAYDVVVPRAAERPAVEPSFGSDLYEPVSSLQRQGQPARATCPLDGPAYEFVQPRKSSHQQEPGDETLPFAPIPGYEPMQPPDQKEFEYEVLSPGQGEYETVGFAGAPGGLGSTAPPPVYEIAPLPRSLPRPPPDGTRSLPPGMAPPPPPQGASGVVETPWFEKPRSMTTDPSPKRVMNEYQEWPPPAPRPDDQRSGAYEQVRVEGPSQGVVDWKAAARPPPRVSAGEYCVLSEAAKGPDACSLDRSTTSSGTNSLSEPFTPPFSPPSPATAQTAVFDAFATARRAHQLLPEVPESGPPAIGPRKDSLQDEHFALTVAKLRSFPPSVPEASDSARNPFDHPPAAATGSGPVSPAIPRKGGFATLHQRYSPFSSNEDLTDAGGRVKDQHQDGAEERGGVYNARSHPRHSPLVYENVLFTRTESISSAQKPSENTQVTRREGTEDKARPESYRLSSVPSNSPLDESAEWEKIEAFLSSIGEIEIPETLEDQIASAGKAVTVPDWLRALGLGQYESALMANGFDELSHLNGVLEEQDLLEVGVEDPSHRRIAMEAAKALPPAPYVSDPGGFKPEGVEDWLELIDLPEYADVFRHQGYSSMARVTMLWEVELTSVLEINTLGHRRRMLASLKVLVPKPVPKPRTRPRQEESLYVDTKIFKMQEKLGELVVDSPSTRSAAASTLTGTEGSDALVAATRQLAIQEKLAASRSTWRHEPSVLIHSSVEYTTLYLGSHAVQEITGLASTVDACRKMRLSTAKLQKFPSVILSVSVQGIKFIDARSKILVSYHDMTTISYITQDPEDRHVFAYIARDTKNDKHYCHVFKVNTTDLSAEVTMTIGQAFELAYAHFMEVQSLLPPNKQPGDA